MSKLLLKDLVIKKKKVLMRVDFNVPISGEKIIDDTRIRAALPSISYSLNQGAKLILMSHRGRPQSKPIGTQKSDHSLALCAKKLEELLGQSVYLAPDCIGPAIENYIEQLQPGQVILLENLRFHPAEEEPLTDFSFVKNLAKLGDCYVNDAFGTAHRKHASTFYLAACFPGKAAMGFLMQKEIEFLNAILIKPSQPFYAVMGGAKVSSKMSLLKTLIPKVQGFFIGGGMAYTFLKAQGHVIGDSLYEEPLLKEAKELMQSCQERAIACWLPIDHRVAKSAPSFSLNSIKITNEIPKGYYGGDIGPKTVSLFARELQKGSTIFWNGPLGIIEQPPFDQGTVEIAKVLSTLAATTVVGGGESIAALQANNLADKMTYLSTGGGATLEYIELGQLPCIEALSDN